MRLAHRSRKRPCFSIQSKSSAPLFIIEKILDCEALAAGLEIVVGGSGAALMGDGEGVGAIARQRLQPAFLAHVDQRSARVGIKHPVALKTLFHRAQGNWMFDTDARSIPPAANALPQEVQQAGSSSCNVIGCMTLGDRL